MKYCITLTLLILTLTACGGASTHTETTLSGADETPLNQEVSGNVESVGVIDDITLEAPISAEPGSESLIEGDSGFVTE